MIDKGISAILFDCGTLLRWNRPPTGIVRIQLEVAKYLLQSPYKVVFIAFAPDKQSLLTIPKETLESKIDFFTHYAPTQNKPFNPLKHLSAVPKRLKNFANAMQQLQVLRFVERIRFKSNTLKSYTEGINDELSPLALPQIPRSTRTLFNKESLLITIGLDWEDSNYALLAQLKHELKFRVVGIFCDAFILKNPQWAMGDELIASFMLHFYHLCYLCDSIAAISEASKAELQTLLATHKISANPDIRALQLGNCDDKPSKTDSKPASPAPAVSGTSGASAPLPAVVAAPTITLHRDPVSGELIGGEESPAPKTQQPLKLSKWAHSSPYILYVSTIEPRKNHLLLLDVWQHCIDSHQQIPHLVLVGMRGWGVSEFWQRLKNEKLRQYVFWYDNIGDEQLHWLYGQSLFGVFPSFDEGLGLGACESLAHGKPVLISDSRGLVEATQSLMPALDPTNKDVWVEWILRLSNDSNELQALTRKAQQFKRKSWHDFAQSFVQFALKEDK